VNTYSSLSDMSPVTQALYEDLKGSSTEEGFVSFLPFRSINIPEMGEEAFNAAIDELIRGRYVLLIDFTDEPRGTLLMLVEQVWENSETKPGYFSDADKLTLAPAPAFSKGQIRPHGFYQRTTYYDILRASMRKSFKARGNAKFPHRACEVQP
jgi:hypothetical protein